ncbi:unnamed protein product [Paramecium octaurelia]|uniref:Uncharacterized protein n=1 Tax=Paramecium octaurelia TaxID=43137 RepID=A0A8S1WYK7_PAROT|nr:unnamed protein product [Paramecium octaurelia]
MGQSHYTYAMNLQKEVIYEFSFEQCKDSISNRMSSLIKCQRSDSGKQYAKQLQFTKILTTQHVWKPRNNPNKMTRKKQLNNYSPSTFFAINLISCAQSYRYYITRF